jgi:hypothetical protein
MFGAEQTFDLLLVEYNGNFDLGTVALELDTSMGRFHHFE